ncbi:MAG: DsbA family protein [Actinomycetota bacterium]|nr:DsbA family protein [Actinomycetota bacterium]
MPELKITEFTDPGCPFAWSAEPARRRVQWLYGEQLSWELCMVGLSTRPSDYEDKGFTPERQASSFSHRHHMPIDFSLRPRMAATMPACRAVVAVRRHVPEQEAAMLRALRVLHFSGWLLDEPATLAAAADQAGIDPDALAAWMSEPETEDLLAADLEAARQPTPSALGLVHKLAGTDDGGHRYTCPSYEIQRSDGVHLSVPGFQPVDAYEVAIANLLPEARRGRRRARFKTSWSGPTLRWPRPRWPRCARSTWRTRGPSSGRWPRSSTSALRGSGTSTATRRSNRRTGAPGPPPPRRTRVQVWQTGHQ